MGPLLKARHRAIGGAGRFGDLLLGEPQLKPPLAQVRRDRADLAKGADALVFGASVAVRGSELSRLCYSQQDSGDRS